MKDVRIVAEELIVLVKPQLAARCRPVQPVAGSARREPARALAPFRRTSSVGAALTVTSEQREHNAIRCTVALPPQLWMLVDAMHSIVQSADAVGGADCLLRRESQGVAGCLFR